MAAPPSPSAPLSATSTIKRDLKEYYAVTENTTKLSQRRQTTNDILTGVNVVFLTAMGAVIVSSHLKTWWVTAILGLITAFAVLFDITWIRLLNRYKRLISLRINYLTVLEDRLRQAGAFIPMEIPLGKNTKPIQTRGVYTLEYFALYHTGKRGGFIRHERFIVILFIVAEIVVTAAIAILTELIALHILDPLSL